MHYISTRGEAPAIDFEQATLAGLAPDGGLYMPVEWPAFSEAEMQAMRAMNYARLTATVLAKFAGDCIAQDDLQRLCDDAYRNFSHPAIAPLKPLPAPASLFHTAPLHLLELFHGPTFAFKDFALQVLGRLFAHFLDKRGARCTIIGATSGDTGSAAIEAVRGRAAITLYMLHPHGRVSDVQRRQMTTVADANIHNLAVDGDFDDCQNLVKTLFADTAFRARHNLAAVNSINWARIAAQVAYYFYAALQLGGAVNFAVPTGNFGNVFAGYVARKMGLPIRRLIIGSNANDILPRFFASGRMQRRAMTPTIAPSMDIQVSSNFERYLFELVGRDAEAVRAMMHSFAEEGEFAVSAAAHGEAAELFFARGFDDDAARAEIKRVHEECGELLDPHSAIGVAAARTFVDAAAAADDAPTVALATAHAAKFGDAVWAAAGVEAAVPEALQRVLALPERMQRVANDTAAVKAVIAGGARRRG